MTKYYLAILMLFWSVLCHAQIKQINHMEDIFNHLKDVDSKTLVIFDVDMVLVQPSDPAFQMANMKRFSAISKRIMKEVPIDKQMIFLSLMTIHSSPVLMDSRIPLFLRQMHQRGVPTMALTANLTGEFNKIKCMEKWRVESLRSLGIDFSQSAPCQERFVLDHLADYRGNYSIYLDGILFVNGTNLSKGEVFLAFLEKTHFSPNKVIFIDDREDNLKSLETAIQKLPHPIEYVGLHFLGAQHYPSELLTEKEFELRWQKLVLEAKEIN